MHLKIARKNNNLAVVLILFLSSMQSVMASNEVTGVYQGAYKCSEQTVEWVMEVVYRDTYKVDVLLKTYGGSRGSLEQLTERKLQGDFLSRASKLLRVTHEEFAKSGGSGHNVKTLDFEYQKSGRDELLRCNLNGSECRQIELKKDKKETAALRKRLEGEKKAFSDKLKSDPLAINLPYFEGDWHGLSQLYGNKTQQLKIHIGKSASWLQIGEGDRYSFSALTPESGSVGEMVFLIADRQAMTIRKIKMTIRDLGYDKVINVYTSEAGDNFGYATRVRRTLTIGKERIKMMVGKYDPRTIRYSDWQSRPATGKSKTADPDERLKLLAARLNGVGRWKCLSQVEMMAFPGKITTFHGKEGGTTLYVIYAPSGNDVLEFGLSTSNDSQKLLEGEDYDYPIVLTGGRLSTNTTFTFELSHSAGGKAPENPVPVTVYMFGNSYGDYGSGCKF